VIRSEGVAACCAAKLRKGEAGRDTAVPRVAAHSKSEAARRTAACSKAKAMLGLASRSLALQRRSWPGWTKARLGKGLAERGIVTHSKGEAEPCNVQRRKAKA